MRKKWKGRPYQLLSIDFFQSHPRCNLWARMGMGKTSSVATYLDIGYTIMGWSEPTLVLAPKRVAQSTWPDEFQKWDHLDPKMIGVAVGTAAERERALKAVAHTPILAINYDNLPWLLDWYEERKKPWPFRRVVADESTRLKSFRTKQGGVRAQALGRVAHADVKEWINLTGSPSPNGLKDLWGQNWFIDAGQRLGSSYAKFEDRWFGYKRVTDSVSGKTTLKPVIFPFSQQQIQERLADVTLTLDPKDWFDLKDPIVSVVKVDLPPSARQHYRELEKEFYTELLTPEGVAGIEVFNSGSKSLKCLQAASGALYLPADRYKPVDGEPRWIEIHDAKLEALESIVEEAAGAPVLVAYHFKSDLARLQRAFPEGRPLDDDPLTITEWNAGRIPILFAHPASAGHGLNLQDGGNIIVFFSHWWDMELHDQIIERIGPVRQLQSGHDRNVFIYYIVARRTVDELVMQRHIEKRDVQDILLDYMKGYRNG